MINTSDNKVHLWPHGVVTYDLSSNYSWYQKEVITDAIDYISKTTCIKFVERSESNFDDYIEIHPGPDCRSNIGNLGGHQRLSLAYDCVYFQTVLHELMHTLGIDHEHTRPDRDKYIKINWDNIDDRYRSNFYIRNNTAMLREFDFNSLMMYSAHDFAKRPHLAVIESRVEGQHIVERYEKATMSGGDVENINLLYNCYQ